MNTMMKRLAMPLVALVVLSANGCATYDNLAPAPKQQAQINIVDVDSELSGGGDLPIGALKVADAPLVISGHQGNNNGAMMFGLIGALIADSAGESEAQNRIKNVKERLTIGMEKIFKQTVAEEIKNGNYANSFAQTEQKKNIPTLRVTPVLLISYVDETNVKPYVALKLGLYDDSSNRIWSTRYFASNGEARPLEGANSWTANENAAIKENITASMKKAVKIMLRDMTTSFTRDENNLVSIEDYFPYVKQKLKVVGYKLAEEDGYVVFAPKLGDVNVFSGINIINTKTAKVKPAGKDAPVFSLVQN